MNEKRKCMLPKLSTQKVFESCKKNRLLIIAEGFEPRALTWIEHASNCLEFADAIICKYEPSSGDNKFDELVCAVEKRCTGSIGQLNYNRFEPVLFEQRFSEILNNCSPYDEIFIDITVMSKMLIMIILYLLRDFDGNIRIIYTEPDTWGPSEDEFKAEILKKSTESINHWIGLSSFGLDSVVKTPKLSSVAMQSCPIFLISFFSFNTSLTWALLDEISPPKMQFINHSCQRHMWRANAMHEINDKLIKDYATHGIDFEENITVDKLNYMEVFQALAKIYKERCYKYRIIIAPTGGKLHAIASALFKICCPDVHVEYPTPRGYSSDNYSSADIHAIHQVEFENFKNFTIGLANSYKLNG